MYTPDIYIPLRRGILYIYILIICFCWRSSSVCLPAGEKVRLHGLCCVGSAMMCASLAEGGSGTVAGFYFFNYRVGDACMCVSRVIWRRRGHVFVLYEMTRLTACDRCLSLPPLLFAERHTHLTHLIHDSQTITKQLTGRNKQLMEFRVSPEALLPVGFRLRAQHFVAGQKVDVCGTSKGKGFQGGMKRWGFKGQAASHGVSKTHRYDNMNVYTSI